MVAALLVIPVGAVYASTVNPQLEKLPQDMADWYHSITNAELAHNSRYDNVLQEDWRRQISYAVWSGTLGAELPHPSEPDIRDPTRYVPTQANAVCAESFILGTEPDRNCLNQIANARIAYMTWQMRDLMTLMHMNPDKFISTKASPDTLHERAVICENPDRLWLNVVGDIDWNGTDEETVKLKAFREAFNDLKIFYIENNLPGYYKDAMSNHIANNTFVEFYEPFETKVTHPQGNNFCDLG